jgi:glycine C-acetyltransferase
MNYRKELQNMSANDSYKGGENFDLRQILLRGRRLPLRQKIDFFQSFIDDLVTNRDVLSMRCISTAADREVTVTDPFTGDTKRMLMFGSNNYLGLANHRYVRERAQQAIREYGAGIGGPPLLNGYTALHRELEERLAALKGAEDALIFSSGYGANVGLVTGLVNADDTMLYDAYSHASFCDGVKMAGVEAWKFPHNNIDKLQKLLQVHVPNERNDVFVGVEGVYSMDGDLAPLDILVPLCKSHSAILVVDDAHGTGAMGPTGRGTAEHFGVEGQVDVTMGTFSKVFAVTGGFVAASKPIINYLRYFARSYMFSASLPPVVIATVLAGLDVMEHEPELLTALRDNVEYTATGLRSLGFDVDPKGGIIPLRVPVGMDIRKAAYRLHELGIFVNSIEYPAVPVSQQRFRISLMATHKKEDIDRLLSCIAEVWAEFLTERLSDQPTIERQDQ